MSDDLATARGRRARLVAGLAMRTVGGRVVAGVRERAGAEGAIGRFHDRNAQRYFELFGRSKGVLMKAAQMLSMVDVAAVGADEFVAYQQTLARLQTEAPRMPVDQAVGLLEADIGRPVEDVFADFSADPVATASIGQVHQAVLVDGRAVAVKVQYPGVAEAIRADLANTELLVAFWQMAQAGTGIKLAGIHEIVSEVSVRIAGEVDYRQEAANITAFGRLYRDHPFIRVPEVIGEASGDRVLTMTYLDGLDWAAAQHADAALKNTWAEVIFRFLAGSYRNGTVYHCDPHPWNCRFGADGTVGFVDFGCVKTLTEQQRSLIVKVGRLALDGRARELHQLMIDSGFLPNADVLGPDAVLAFWREILHELVAEQPATYTAETVDRLVRAMVDVRGADHPLRHLVIPREYAMMWRIEISQAAIYSALDATFHPRAVLDELDGVAAPCTPLGHAHDAWVRGEGLPYGLQSR